MGLEDRHLEAWELTDDAMRNWPDEPQPALGMHTVHAMHFRLATGAQLIRQEGTMSKPNGHELDGLDEILEQSDPVTGVDETIRLFRMGLEHHAGAIMTCPACLDFTRRFQREYPRPCRRDCAGLVHAELEDVNREGGLIVTAVCDVCCESE